MHNRLGFTLIEILVVIIIISIIASAGLLAFGDFGVQRRIKLAAEQFRDYLILIEQQAILENRPMGINVRNDGYYTYRSTSNSSWQLINKPRALQTHFFPKNTVIDFQSGVRNAPSTPDILIDNSGNCSAFTLIFKSGPKSTVAILTNTERGKLSLSHDK